MNNMYKKLYEWKTKLIGKTFTFLTVVDVIHVTLDNGKKRYMAVCDCKCGNRVNVDVYGISKGHNKSCGCYEKSKENSTRHKEINAKNKDIRSIAKKEWCQNNPDKVKEIGRKRSEWCKSNPDKVAEASKKYSQWCKDNPDKVKAKTEKCLDWRRNNKEDVSRMIENSKAWREDSERVNLAVQRRLDTLSRRPESRRRISESRSTWIQNNNELFIKSINAAHAANKSIAIKRRQQIDFSSILDLVHPDYYDTLISGHIGSDDCILLKCTACGEYSFHKLGSIFTMCKQQIRDDCSILCDTCKATLITSKYEKDILDCVSEFYNGTCIRNDRSVLNGKELDLYYPEKKIAIEFNGDYWHSDAHKSNDYHYNKFKACNDLGVTLVSIFEHMWNEDSNSIKCYLRDLYNDTENKISFYDGLINNNYPLPNMTTLIGEYIESYYVAGKHKVYTCGYTKVT